MDQHVDTLTGVQVATPWTTVDSTLVVDLKCSLASVRYTRNVLSARSAIRSQNNIKQELTFVLDKTEQGKPPTEYEHVCPPSNVGVVLVSNRPVRLRVTNESGSLDVGLTKMFVLMAPTQKVFVSNDEQEGPAEIILIVI